MADHRGAPWLVFLLLIGSGCAPSFTAADADVRVVFKVGDPANPITADQLKDVRSIVEQRLRSSEVVPQFLVESHEPDELVVLTPQLSDEQLAAVKDLATRPGTLEFALLANTRDHARLITAAQAPDGEAPADPTSGYAWIPVGIGSDGQPFKIGEHDSIMVRETQTDGQTRKEVLVVLNSDDRRVTDKLLKRAFQDFGQNGTPTFGFELATQGGYLMKRMTSEALPASDGFKRRLGIILDGKMLSAPTINNAIESKGIIEGGFTVDEINHMATSFNAGRLPAPVRFVGALRFR